MLHFGFPLLVGAPILLLSYFIYTCIYNIFFSPFRDVPGPLLWRLSPLPYTLSHIRGTKHRDLLQLHEKYGPVVHICPTEISYANSAIWKDAWAHRQGHAEFSKDIHSAPVNGVDSIVSANRENHGRYRRMFSHAFSTNGLREQEPRVKHYVDLLMAGLTTRGKDSSVNLVEWFNWTTFDLISDLTFGESFGCLENGRTHGWIDAIFGNLATLVFVEAT